MTSADSCAPNVNFVFKTKLKFSRFLDDVAYTCGAALQDHYLNPFFLYSFIYVNVLAILLASIAYSTSECKKFLRNKNVK